MRRLLVLFLLASLTGCGSDSSGNGVASSSSTGPALRAEGGWVGGGADVDLSMTLAQRGSIVTGTGLMTRGGKVEAVSLGGEIDAAGSAHLHTLHQDAETDQDNGTLDVRFGDNPPQATYTDFAGTSIFTLERPSTTQSRAQSEKFWDNILDPFGTINPAELYIAQVEGQDWRGNFHRFNLRIFLQGATVWEWVGGWEKIDGDDVAERSSGRVAAFLTRDKQTAIVYLKDSSTTVIIGELVFHRFNAGLAGSSVPLDLNSSWLQTNFNGNGEGDVHPSTGRVQLVNPGG